jgi:GNAT superfamily N-acetyltransferase
MRSPLRAVVIFDALETPGGVEPYRSVQARGMSRKEHGMTHVRRPEPSAAHALSDALSRYPTDLESDVTTMVGTTMHVRPIRPDDASRLVSFHEGLTSRSVYRRFFSAHPVLSPVEVERFTCVDYVDRLALVAEIDGRLVAVARYDRDPGGPDAEVAFVVADLLQHQGIATVLLDMLAQAAWRCGITTFVASTLAENRAMLDVFRGSGFAVTTRTTYGVVEVRFSIDPISHDEHTVRGPEDAQPARHSDGPFSC